MPSQNEYMQEVSYKSDEGKVLKNRGDGFWERRRGNLQIKNANVTNTIPK